MKSIEVNDKNLSDILSKEGITVLDFWAPWCGPCRVVGPIIDQLAENNEDVQVGKLNVDDNSSSASKFGIRGIPTIMFFKDGEKVKQISGIQTLVDYQEIIDNLKL